MTQPATRIDPVLAAATRLIIDSRFADAGTLQRGLRVGFAEAHRLLDAMADAGIVGPSQGSLTRDVLVADVDEALRRLEAAAR